MVIPETPFIGYFYAVTTLPFYCQDLVGLATSQIFGCKFLGIVDEMVADGVNFGEQPKRLYFL